MNGRDRGSCYCPNPGRKSIQRVALRVKLKLAWWRLLARLGRGPLHDTRPPLPSGYCGWCSVCGRSGHTRHHPYFACTDAWCDECYDREFPPLTY